MICPRSQTVHFRRCPNQTLYKSGYTPATTTRLSFPDKFAEWPGATFNYDAIHCHSDKATSLNNCAFNKNCRCKNVHNSPIPDYERSPLSWSRFLGSQPTDDICHKPGGRLSLLSTRPTVTLPAKEITPLASTKLCNYTAWWQRHTNVSSLQKATM